MSEAVPIQPGMVLLDKYRIEEHVGAGGMGAVYKAREIDFDIGRFVAIKILPPQLAADEKLLTRFRAEMKIAASLDHPNIVPIYLVGTDQGLHFFVMKFLEGRTLSRVVREDGAFNSRQMASVFVQVTRALEYMHERDCIHRDIKSTNIMAAPNGRVTLMDFGIAKVQGESTLTRAGEVLGTAPYMAPEQWEGEADHRSDIYSLGIVMYEMATGGPPFAGKSLPEIMRKHISELPTPIADIRADLSPALARIIMRCLAKSPDARYRSAGDIRRDLRAMGLFDADERTFDTIPRLSQTLPRADATIPMEERIIEPVRPLTPELGDPKPPVPVLKKIRSSDKCLAQGDLAGALWHLEQLVESREADPALVADQIAALRLMTDWEEQVRRQAESAIAEKRYADAEIALSPVSEVYEFSPLSKLLKEVVRYRDETARVFDRAQEHQFRMRYGKAERLYRKVLEREPDMDLAEDRIQMVRKLRARQRRRSLMRVAVLVLMLAGLAGGVYVYRKTVSPYAANAGSWLAEKGYYTNPPLANADALLRAASLLDAENPDVKKARRSLKRKILREADLNASNGIDLEALDLYRQALVVDPEDEALRLRVEALRTKIGASDD